MNFFVPNESHVLLSDFFFFFFFLIGRSKASLINQNKKNTSWRRAYSIKQGFSSIQAWKSTIPIACFANKCADLLPCLRVCENSTQYINPHKTLIPDTTAATEEGGEVLPHRALYTTKESPSMIKSWIPMSLTNWTPTSTAFTSVKFCVQVL